MLEYIVGAGLLALYGKMRGTDENGDWSLSNLGRNFSEDVSNTYANTVSRFNNEQLQADYLNSESGSKSEEILEAEMRKRHLL